jgi:hypothetical protein
MNELGPIYFDRVRKRLSNFFSLLNYISSFLLLYHLSLLHYLLSSLVIETKPLSIFWHLRDDVQCAFTFDFTPSFFSVFLFLFSFPHLPIQKTLFQLNKAMKTGPSISRRFPAGGTISLRSRNFSYPISWGCVVFRELLFLDKFSWLLSSFSIQFICSTPNIVRISPPHCNFHCLK